MTESNTSYLAIQINQDRLNYIERLVPDYASFDYTVKVIKHDTGFSNWYNTYEIYDKDKRLTGIKFNGWETNSYFKQEGSSWNGGSIIKTDLMDNKRRIRIININEVENVNRWGFASGNNFEDTMNALILFFNSFLDWDAYDKNNKSKTKDEVIAALKKENDSMKNIIDRIQQILITENADENKAVVS